MTIILAGIAAVIFIIAVILLMQKPESSQAPEQENGLNSRIPLHDNLQAKVDSSKNIPSYSEEKAKAYSAGSGWMTGGVARGILIIVLVAVGIFLYKDARGKPSAKSVEPAVREYLMGERGKDCSIEKLENIRVGNYDKMLQGWPVYADFRVVSQGEIGSTTWVGDEPGSDAMTCLATRNKSGKISCDLPQMFQNALKDMEKKIQAMAE